MAERQRLPIDFDTLAPVAFRCLHGRGEGFVKVDTVPLPLPGIVVFRLSHSTLGEFGTVEITSRGAGMSQLYWTGLPHSLDLPPELRTAKEDHFQLVKDAFYFMVSQELVTTIEDDTPQWLKNILDAMHKANDPRVETVRRYYMGEVDAPGLAEEWGQMQDRKIYSYEVYKYFTSVKADYPEFVFLDKRHGTAIRVNRAN